MKQYSAARLGVFFLVTLVMATACSGAREPQSAPKGFSDSPEDVARDLWEVTLAESPVWATMLGDRRFDALLPDISEGARQAVAERKAQLFKRLENINAGYLDGESRITAKVLAVVLQDDMDSKVCQFDLWNVDQLGGYQTTLPEIAAYQQIDSATAAAAYLARLNRISVLMDQHIQNLKLGLASGFRAPRVAALRVLRQLDDLLQQAPTNSPYLAALSRTRNLSETESKNLRTNIISTVRSAINPALERYRTYLRNVYLSSARHEPGVLANADGAACYAQMARQYSGGVLTPEALHGRGLSELDKAGQEMLAIAKTAGFANAAAYAKALEADPNQHVQSGAALVDFVTRALRRAEAALPGALRHVPPARVEVRAIEPYREADAPSGYYYAAAEDGTHPAYYYVNTFKPETRALFNLEALTFHEGVPGHHVQIATAQTLLALPAVRRHLGMTTYVEGWGLYAEGLADELGLYSGPAARFGMLNYRAWRAARLVVDTGIHALGWTRERAVGFMRDTLALSPQEIDNEVDRYIVWPGQALAYMSGRLEILSLREQAQRRLGRAYDMRDFHDHVLRSGALPMPILREVVTTWLANSPPG